MDIIVRKNGKYKDVEIHLDNSKHELGLFDKDECRELAIMLENAADELCTGYDYAPEDE